MTKQLGSIRSSMKGKGLKSPSPSNSYGKSSMVSGLFGGISSVVAYQSNSFVSNLFRGRSAGLSTQEAQQTVTALTSQSVLSTGTGRGQTLSPIQLDTQKSFPSVSFYSGQAIFQNQKQNTGLGAGILYSPRTKTKQNQGQGLIQIQRPKQTTRQITRQINIHQFGFGDISFATPTIPINFRPTTKSYPPILPSFYLSSMPGKGNSLFGSFNPRYIPSLTAEAFNLRGIVPKRFRGGVIDPFARRLIPQGKNRKRRRKTSSI